MPELLLVCSRRSLCWEFDKDGRELNVRVEGQLVFNESRMALLAATAGAGLAFLLEGQVRPMIADGRLVRVLATFRRKISNLDCCR